MLGLPKHLFRAAATHTRYGTIPRHLTAIPNTKAHTPVSVALQQSRGLAHIKHTASAFRTLPHTYQQRRDASSSFSMDNTVRGRLRPYMLTIQLISLFSTLVLLSGAGLYVAINNHLETKYPISDEIKRKETRRLLRGASMREHLIVNHQIAYLLLLRALEQIYQDNELDERSPPVQEIIVRLARAAYRAGQWDPAEGILLDVWRNVVDSKSGVPVEAPVLVSGDRVIVYEPKWRDEQIARIADVLGPLEIDKAAYKAAIRTFGTALQAAKRLETRAEEVQEETGQSQSEVRDGLWLRQANLVTSLGEAFALDEDLETARTLFESVLVDIRKRSRGKKRASADGEEADLWTCLDAVVMNNLAQVEERRGDLKAAAVWVDAGLKAAAEWPGVRSCDNCRAHLLFQSAVLNEKSGDLKGALEWYSSALEFGRASGTGDLERAKGAIERVQSRLLDLDPADS